MIKINDIYDEEEIKRVISENLASNDKNWRVMYSEHSISGKNKEYLIAAIDENGKAYVSKAGIVKVSTDGIVTDIKVVKFNKIHSEYTNCWLDMTFNDLYKGIESITTSEKDTLLEEVLRQEKKYFDSIDFYNEVQSRFVRKLDAIGGTNLLLTFSKDFEPIEKCILLIKSDTFRALSDETFSLWSLAQTFDISKQDCAESSWSMISKDKYIELVMFRPKECFNTDFSFIFDGHLNNYDTASFADKYIKDFVETIYNNNGMMEELNSVELEV